MSDISEDSRVQQRNRIETSSTTVIGNPQTDRAASITEKSPYFLPLHFILICHNGEHGCCPDIHLAEGRTLLTSSFQDEARTVRKKVIMEQSYAFALFERPGKFNTLFIRHEPHFQERDSRYLLRSELQSVCLLFLLTFSIAATACAPLPYPLRATPTSPRSLTR